MCSDTSDEERTAPKVRLNKLVTSGKVAFCRRNAEPLVNILVFTGITGRQDVDVLQSTYQQFVVFFLKRRTGVAAVTTMRFVISLFFSFLLSVLKWWHSVSK